MVCFRFGTGGEKKKLRTTRSSVCFMAIYVKCSSCGEIYDELLNTKCPKCGCEEIIKMHYDDNKLVEGDSKDIKKYSDYDLKHNEGYEDKIENNDDEFIPKTPFPFTEVPVIFSSVYAYFFKNDNEIKYGKLLLIVLAELLLGIVLAAIGYFYDLWFEERTYELGVGSRRGSRGGMLFMYTGVAAIAHSFYSIVKYTGLHFIGKMKVQRSEQWTRLILFFIEVVLGATLIAIAVYVGLNSSKEKDITGVLLLLGAGLVIGAVWSLIKYLISKHKESDS